MPIFPLFDKVVLTTDDENYSARYPRVEVDYGKDKEVVREIIKRYIDFKNTSNNRELKDMYLSEATLSYLVENANGDIESILQSVNSLDSTEEDYKEKLDAKLLSRKKLKEEQNQQGLSSRFYI